MMEEAVTITGTESPPRAPALEARELTVAAGDRALLHSVSLSIAPGELVALIGPSGAGKTTLLRALSGAGAPYSGSVLLAGEPIGPRNPGVGYVPSDDLLHDQLTVSEELLFAAALRTPAGAHDAELGETVETVLSDLNLTELAGRRVASLSNGERRRTSCGVELVGRPGVLLLDEPAGGLDAGLERRLMRMLRRLADQGRAVLAATHATASLRLCDRVAVLSPGGRLRCVGPVDEILAHFGVDSVEEIYERLDTEAERAAGARLPAGGQAGRRHERPAPAARAVPGFGRQLGIVAPRAALCRLRDHRSLVILIGQAPLIGAAFALVLPRGALADQNLGPYYGVLVSFLLLTASAWLGTVAACREIVGELAIVRREVAVGLRLDAYLAARCLTLFPVVVAQTGLLGVVVLVLQPVPQGAALVVLVCIVTGLASACVGLWLSSWSRTPDQAIASTPLILIPQLLFAGALIPVDRMPLPFRWLADVLVGHWSFDGLGSAMGLGDRLGSTLSGVTGLDATAFAAKPVVPIAAMGAIALVALLLAGRSLAARVDG